MYRIVMLLAWLWGELEGLVERCEIWFLTRRWDRAWGALPALVAALVVGIVVFGQRSKPALARAEPYRRAFRAAVDKRDLPTAELWLRKLTALRMADSATQYQYAELAIQAQQLDLAWQTMRALAPNGSVGYPKAHFWIASQMLRHQRGGWLDRDRLECQAHLIAAKLDPDIKGPAAERLGMIHLMRGEFVAAVREFGEVPTPTIRSQVAGAVAAKYVGDEATCARNWSGALSLCNAELAKAPLAPLSDLRLLAAIALVNLERPAEAIAMLREGLRLTDGHEPRLKQALGLALVGQLGANPNRPRDRNVEQTKLVEELLDLAPDSPAVAVRLLQWSAEQGETGDKVRREMVDRAGTSGATSPTVLSAAGTAAAQAGQLAEARQTLERALASDPQNPLVQNNLAWVLMKSDPPDLERALQLVNAALAKTPNHPQMLETRGQIQLRRREWQAAVQDLEAAWPRLTGSSRESAREALAKALTELGQAERAAEFRSPTPPPSP